MVIGVTGKYCSGKNTVAEILAGYAIEIIDEDRIGHEALEAKRGRIAATFGSGVINSDGSIDRRQLARLVFGDAETLSRLESIVHPWMTAETERRIRESHSRRVAINAALLVKMELHRLCDFVILVRSPALIRFVRGLRRDGFSPFSLLRRMKAQRTLNDGIKNVDTVVVRNIVSKRKLERRIIKILARRGITGRKHDE